MSDDDIVLEDELDQDPSIEQPSLFEDNEVFDLDSSVLVDDFASDKNQLHDVDDNLDDIDISGLGGSGGNDVGIAGSTIDLYDAPPQKVADVDGNDEKKSVVDDDENNAHVVANDQLRSIDDNDFSVDDDDNGDDDNGNQTVDDETKEKTTFTPVRFPAAAASSSSSSSSSSTISVGEMSLKAPDCFVELKVMSPSDSGEGFVRYTVQWTTTLDQYARKTMTVQRRYSDFAWLHDRLTSSNKAALVPPIPGKALNPLNTFDDDFLEGRRFELERFLVRCSQHPALYTSSDFQLFLEASEATLKKARSDKPAQSWGLKIASWLSSSASAMAASAAPEQFGAPVELDPWFGSQAAYVQQMQKALSKVEGSAGRLVSRHLALAETHAQAMRACSETADIEINVSQPTANAFKRLSEISAQTVGLEQHLATELQLRWERQLRDHVRHFAEAQRLIEHRASTLGRFQHHSRAVAAKKERLDSPSLAADEKAKAALAEEIEVAEKSEAEAKDLYENTNASCRAELERFNAIKTAAFRETIAKIAQVEIEHHLQIIDFYKSLLNEVRE
jgi:sorting nexin-1/2